MKREPDLIREILLQVEAAGQEGIQQFRSEAFDTPTIAYHVRLLHDAGYITGVVKPMFGGNIACNIAGMSWEGHDLIDAIKNDTVWARTKAAIAEKGGGATIEVIKALATSYAKAHFGL
jgi:hypothetical protein